MYEVRKQSPDTLPPHPKSRDRLFNVCLYALHGSKVFVEMRTQNQKNKIKSAFSPPWILNVKKIKSIEVEMEVEGSGRPMFEVERFLANEGKKTFILDLFHLICCGHQWSINHSHTYLTDLSICLSWVPYFLLFIFYFLFFIFYNGWNLFFFFLFLFTFFNDAISGYMNGPTLDFWVWRRDMRG